MLSLCVICNTLEEFYKVQDFFIERGYSYLGDSYSYEDPEKRKITINKNLKPTYQIYLVEEDHHIGYDFNGVITNQLSYNVISYKEFNKVYRISKLKRIIDG